VKRKREKSGLTLVEIITVLAIIALLTGILIPAVSAVKTAAKNAKQKGQLATIELGLTAFKNDYGDYPPSNWPFRTPGAGDDYCGAQKLCEALLGLDLLGFHPKSEFTANGTTAAGVNLYDAGDLGQRKKPYIELGKATAIKLGGRPDGLFPAGAIGPLNPDTHVICDVFGATNVVLPGGQSVKAGAPILYYRADTSGTTIGQVYDYLDDAQIILAKEAADGRPHPLGTGIGGVNGGVFFWGNPGLVGYIQDPKITAKPWPYRPGSFILISAGADGIYGTGDDIRNFGD